MSRHRIEIEFEVPTARHAEEFLDDMSYAVQCELGRRETEVTDILLTMTPVVDIAAAIRRGIEQAHEGKVTHRSFLDDLTKRKEPISSSRSVRRVKRGTAQYSTRWRTCDPRRPHHPLTRQQGRPHPTVPHTVYGRPDTPHNERKLMSDAPTEEEIDIYAVAQMAKVANVGLSPDATLSFCREIHKLRIEVAALRTQLYGGGI